MTVHELSRLYYLKKLIDRDTERIAELESRLQGGSVPISDMPRNPNTQDTFSKNVILLIELKEKLERERTEYIKERLIIEDYIRTVEDYQLRLIFSYRFVDLMTWRQIALLIGGNNTEDSVKKTCYRALKRQ